MQPIRKKKKHSMPRSLRYILPAVLAVLCIAALILLKGSTDRIPDTETGKQKEDIPNPAVESREQEIHALSAYGEDMLFSISVRPDEGEPYMLSYSGGNLYLDGDTDMPVRKAFAPDMIYYASELPVMENVCDLSSPDSAGLSLSDFGLDPACCRVTVTWQDGSSKTVDFGDPVMQGNFVRYYMAETGSDTVWLVSSDMYDMLTLKKHMLHEVSFSLPDPSLIDRVSFYSENEEDCYSLVQKDSRWYVERNGLWPADAGKMQQFLKNFARISFSSWIGEADSCSPGQYGFDTPRLEITITAAPTRIDGYDENGQFISAVQEGKEYHLTVGNDYSTSAFYCILDETVYIATRFSLGFLISEEASYYEAANPVNIPANALSSVTVSSSGNESHAYSLSFDERVLPNGQLETDSNTGEYIYDISVTKNGTAIDTIGFLTWYSSVTKLAGTVQAGGISIPPDTEPLYTITVHTGETVRTVEFIPYDSVFCIIRSDGCVRYLIETAQLTVLGNCP